MVGGGCFWCTEAVFSEVDGVVSILPGYAGGSVPNPTYEQVCTGQTGHAEVVQVTFDPAKLAFADLLRIFFTTHDPTTKDRQGADVGTQYRSLVIAQNDAQRRTTESVIRELESEGVWRGRIVTQIVPPTPFYPAEEYHRQYFRRNPEKGYCQMVISPKLAKFRKMYASRLRAPVIR